MYGTVNNVDVKGTSKTGITFGMLVDKPLGKSHVSFQPSLNYVQKGKVISEATKSKNYLALRYAETHINFLYNSNTKTNFFIGGGPALSFDLPSQYVLKTSNATAANLNPKPKFSRAETSVLFGKDAASNFKGLDYGVNLMTGVRMKCGFFFGINYTYGIRNLVPVEKAGDEIRNACFSIKTGFLFKNK
jgi:Outer membrane protein beta-barrel domain